MPGSSHPTKHQEQCQCKAGARLWLLLHPRFFPLSPVPVPCILLSLAGCECLSCSEFWHFGLQPRSLGYKPEPHFLPPAHCARAGSCAAPAAPALSSHPEVTWPRSILAAPGGAKPSPGSSGWEGAESSQALSLLSVGTAEPPSKSTSQCNPQNEALVCAGAKMSQSKISMAASRKALVKLSQALIGATTLEFNLPHCSRYGGQCSRILCHCFPDGPLSLLHK